MLLRAERMTMAQGPDIPPWAYVVGGGAVATLTTKLFDYLKVRLRAASGDRREAESGLGRLIARLEKRLDATEIQAGEAQKHATAADQRVARCEEEHAVCRAQVTLLTDKLNEALGRLGLGQIQHAACPEAGDE